MAVHNKRYQAEYYQFNDADAVDGMWKYMELNPKASVEDAATAIVDEAIKHYAVWFMINQDRYDHRYRILMYYDNGYNQANGDDL